MNPSDPSRNYSAVQTYGPIATFAERNILPPAGVYIAQDDTIQLRSWAPRANQTVRVTLRILNNNGQIVPTQTTATVAANGATVQLNTCTADEGFLISASIDGDASRRGLCFCQLVLKRGQGSSDTALGGILCSGYVSQYGQLTYPNGVIQDGMDGRGAFVSVLGADPVAGAEATITVPGGVEWSVKAFSVGLVTSGVAGTRRPCLVYDDGGGNTVGHSVIAAGVGAGVTLTIAWGFGLNVQTGNVVYSAPLVGDTFLRSGSIIRTITDGLDAGDNYGFPRLLIEEKISQ